MTAPAPLVLAAGSVLDAGPEAVIDAAAAAGFAGVGLRISAEHAPADPAALRRRAGDLGVVIYDVEVYRIGGDAPAEPLLDTAAALGAAAVLVVSDVGPARTVEEVGDLAAASRARGLRLGLEYMAWTTPSRPDEAVAVARATGAAVVVDVLHHCRVGAGAAELTAVARSGVLGWVQICDAPGAGPSGGGPDLLITEARHHRLVPGAGDLPLVELLAAVPPGTAISVEVQSDTLLALDPAARAVVLRSAAAAVLTAAAAHRAGRPD